MKRRCDLCEWWNSPVLWGVYRGEPITAEDERWCTRHPNWAQHHANDWCGEFEAKEEEKGFESFYTKDGRLITPELQESVYESVTEEKPPIFMPDVEEEEM